MQPATLCRKKALKWLLETLGMVTQEERRISQAPVVGSLI